jgi:type II secretory pathway predicted ATPase ExeA/septal ring-binding cell division protein DamX
MTLYLEHFGLREAPFRITPRTEFFFAGANRGATLEGLLYAITSGEGLVKVTGEVGSGKTMLCRVLIERLPKTVETIYLAVPSLTRDEMLASVAGDLGIDTAGATTHKLLRALQEKLIALHEEGRQVVALIDEAHAMPPTTLEEIRLLSNLETGQGKLLQIVLFGQPELDAHLAVPEMRQLKDRITHSFALSPLPPRDVRDYLDFRLRAAGYRGPDLFAPEPLRIIAEASEGLSRRINIYADKTLLAAFAAGTHTITADHARAAVSDMQIVMAKRAPRRQLVYAAAASAAVGIVVGFVAGQWPAQGPATRLTVAAPANAAPVAAPAPASVVAQAPASLTAPAPAPAAKMEPLPVAEQVTLPADSIAARVAAGRTLLAASDARYAVQLMVTDARERTYLTSYIGDAARSVSIEDLFLIPSGSDEAPRFDVLYGAYPDRGAALSALNALPASLRQFSPYVRALEPLRQEARRPERS